MSCMWKLSDTHTVRDLSPTTTDMSNDVERLPATTTTPTVMTRTRARSPYQVAEAPRRVHIVQTGLAWVVLVLVRNPLVPRMTKCF